MQTIFDWVSLAIFAGLVVLFLQRSTEAQPSDKLWQYLLPSVGCAVANYLGNNGMELFAYLCLAAVIGYIYFVLKPFQNGSGSSN